MSFLCFFSPFSLIVWFTFVQANCPVLDCENLYHYGYESSLWIVIEIGVD